MDPRQFQLNYGNETEGPELWGAAPKSDWTSYNTAPEVVSQMAKLWYGRLIGDPLKSMGAVGAGLIGDVPQVGVDDSTDLRKVGGQYVAQGGEGGVGDIMNALLLYGGPGMATGKPGVASVGVFGGEKALGANLAMKQIAEKALAAGKDPDEVRKITGWFKGMEGKLRFEISDKDFGLVPNFKEKTSGLEAAYLSDVVNHPDLFHSYPELKNLRVTTHNEDVGFMGSFDDGVVSLSNKLSTEDAKVTLLHEIQHWVQDKEGFARGGNVDEMRAPGLGGMLRDESKQYYHLQDQIFNIESQFSRKSWEKYKKPFEDLTSEEKIGVAPQNWWDQYDKLKGELKTVPKTPHAAYERLAGEIEARDVAARSWYEDQMREAVPPDLRKDAIIRWGDKGAEEIALELLK